MAPRFEFRAWADELDSVRDCIASFGSPYEIRESVETYIVSATTGVNPKIRGDRRDCLFLVGGRDLR